MAFKTKADKKFDQKLSELTASWGYLHNLGRDWSYFGDEFELPILQRMPWVYEKFIEVENLFFLYGCYLELIDDEEIVQNEFSYEFEWTSLFPQTKEIEFVGHNEPTLIEEQVALLSGEFFMSADIPF